MASNFRAKVDSTSNFCSNDDKKTSFEENLYLFRSRTEIQQNGFE